MNLNQITIHSSNVLESMAFYQLLGLRLIVDASPRYVRFECPAGDSTFSISHGERMSASTPVIYFEVADVDKVYQQLKQSGLKNLSPPKDQRWLWREAKLTDPDGHQLKIYAAGSNRKYPPWRVPSKKWYDCLIESQHNLMK